MLNAIDHERDKLLSAIHEAGHIYSNATKGRYFDWVRVYFDAELGFYAGDMVLFAGRPTLIVPPGTTREEVARRASISIDTEANPALGLEDYLDTYVAGIEAEIKAAIEIGVDTAPSFERWETSSDKLECDYRIAKSTDGTEAPALMAAARARVAAIFGDAETWAYVKGLGEHIRGSAQLNWWEFAVDDPDAARRLDDVCSEALRAGGALR